MKHETWHIQTYDANGEWQGYLVGARTLDGAYAHVQNFRTAHNVTTPVRSWSGQVSDKPRGVVEQVH